MKNSSKNLTVSFTHTPQEIENDLNRISLQLVNARDNEELLFLLERLDVFSSKLMVFSEPIYELYKTHIQLIREQILEKLVERDCK